VKPLIRRRRVLDQQKMLQDLRHQPEHGLLPALALVLNLLGEMREFERHGRPCPGENGANPFSSLTIH
jgi:hypothetical protein